MTNKERAGEALAAIESFLVKSDLKFYNDAESGRLILTITGESFPITVLFFADESERIATYCKLPFIVPKEKMIDMVMAINYLNLNVGVGKFCLDTDEGFLSFESYEIIAGLSGFNAAYAETLVLTAFTVIDKYVDRLFAVSKGALSIREFASKL